MTGDTKSYETRLRAKIEEVGAQSEATWARLNASEDDPMSEAYKLLQRSAMIMSGSVLGLLMALGELTGESWESEYREKTDKWMLGGS